MKKICPKGKKNSTLKVWLPLREESSRAAVSESLSSACPAFLKGTQFWRVLPTPGRARQNCVPSARALLRAVAVARYPVFGALSVPLRESSVYVYDGQVFIRWRRRWKRAEEERGNNVRQATSNLEPTNQPTNQPTTTHHFYFLYMQIFGLPRERRRRRRRRPI